jgi:uncharacterized membrane protein YhhN
MARMAARSLMSAYVLLGLINVIAVATSNVSAEQLTKPLLMPLLIAWLLVEARRALSAPLLLLLVGLMFAWLGDLLLLGEGDTLLAAGISAFLVTQLAYCLAFGRVPGLRFRRGIISPPREPVRGLVSQHRAIVLPFVAYLVGLTWLLWPTAGSLRVPFLAYGCVLMMMSICALNLVNRMPAKAAWVTFTGSILFVVSDSAIAVTAIGSVPESPASGALVMLTYIAAQGLIALGLLTGVRDLDEARRELAGIRR